MSLDKNGKLTQEIKAKSFRFIFLWFLFRPLTNTICLEDRQAIISEYSTTKNSCQTKSKCQPSETSLPQFTTTKKSTFSEATMAKTDPK